MLICSLFIYLFKVTILPTSLSPSFSFYKKTQTTADSRNSTTPIKATVNSQRTDLSPIAHSLILSGHPGQPYHAHSRRVERVVGLASAPLDHAPALGGSGGLVATTAAAAATAAHSPHRGAPAAVLVGIEHLISLALLLA